MRQVGRNCFSEIYFPGCNPSFIRTSDGVVMVDSPQHPIDAMRWGEHLRSLGPIRYLVNTEPHSDHILGNAYFPEAEVVGQRLLAECFDRYLDIPADLPARIARAKLTDPDSVYLLDHPAYPPHGPTRIFDDELLLELGDHRIRCIHMPGHTAAQTSVVVAEEGVVFTGDNVFFQCRTWLQEADPWAWLAALDAIAALDIDVIVPGHGEPCGKPYLREQRQIIENWLGEVGRRIDRGLDEEEAVAEPIDVRATLDPYPFAQRMFDADVRATTATLRNLYRRLRARRATEAASA